MNAIEISFNRIKWQQIYREIDKSFDQQITFEELFLFVFPDHHVRQALEKTRLKMLGRRVQQMAAKHHEYLMRSGM
jgi:hypothetical protein